MAKTQRDPELTRKQLLDWFCKKLPQGAGDVEVSDLVVPTTTGFSNETLMCDLSWKENGKALKEPLVIRVMPSGFRIFKEYDLARQFNTMRLLGKTSVPVPKMFWMETDASVLGEEFYVMGRVEGKIPTDNPPYHQSGWMVTDVSPTEREKMWWSGLETMSKIHKLDYKAVGFEFLEMNSKKSYAEQHLDFYEDLLKWGGRGEEYPSAERGLKWLRANLPKQEKAAICWGDARLGNLIFDKKDNHVISVLDWEMVELGNPEQDLAWWLFFDTHHSAGVGAPRLEGLPSHEETIERYAKLLGRDLHDMTYYWIQAATSFSILLMRVAIGFKVAGILPEESTFHKSNTATRLLDEMLDKQG